MSYYLNPAAAPYEPGFGALYGVPSISVLSNVQRKIKVDVMKIVGAAEYNPDSGIPVSTTSGTSAARAAINTPPFVQVPDVAYFTLTRFRGDTIKIPFTCVNVLDGVESVPTDLASWTIFSTLKVDLTLADNGAGVIQKQTGADIYLDTATGLGMLIFQASDTQNIIIPANSSSIVFDGDIELVTAAGEVETPVRFWLVLVPEATRRVA